MDYIDIKNGCHTAVIGFVKAFDNVNIERKAVDNFGEKVSATQRD